MTFLARIPSAAYLIVGDSHAARFDGVVIEDPAGPIVAKARWLPGLRVRALFENGMVSEFVTGAIREMRHVTLAGDRAEGPFPPLAEFTSHGETALMPLKPRNPERLVLMFTAGTGDAWDLAHDLYPEYDFDLDEPAPELHGVEPYREWRKKLGITEVRERAQAMCRPLFEAITALRSAGYANVLFHELPPPASRERPSPTPNALRFKLIVLFNQMFREFAQETGTGYVTAWDRFFKDGQRAAQYDGDGEHLNRESAVVSVTRLHELLANSRVK